MPDAKEHHWRIPDEAVSTYVDTEYTGPFMAYSFGAAKSADKSSSQQLVNLEKSDLSFSRPGGLRMMVSRLRWLMSFVTCISASILISCAAKEEIPSREAIPALPAFTKAAYKEYLEDPKYEDFKAFAFDPKGSRWGSARKHWDPYEAIEHALRLCERGGSQCKLYAVGDIVVAGLTQDEVKRVVDTKFPSLRQQAIRNYLSDTEFPNFKAFAIDLETPAWGRAWGHYSPGRAIGRALEECRRLEGRRCRIYAIGRTVLSDVSDEAIERATEEYLQTVLGNAAEAERIAGQWKAKITPKGIDPTLLRGDFDGEWSGIMECSTCPQCTGPLRKAISIRVESNEFALVPDGSYTGSGIVDNEGNVSIRWRAYELASYLRTTKTKRFIFDGKYDGRSFLLQGMRGPRTCKITLTRATSDVSHLRRP